MARILTGGFGENAGEPRRRALYHLAAGCPECGRTLDEVAASDVIWEARVYDGVVLGLRHLVGLRRGPSATSLRAHSPMRG